jgi:HEAT repeat protein
METRRHALKRKSAGRRRKPVTAVACVILCLTLLGFSQVAQANGWEHLAIPRETLLAALNSGDPHAMEHAAISLGVRGEARDVEPLLEALKSADKAPHLRAEIYTALGRIGEARSVPALVRALESETRDELRAAAALALGSIGAAKALPALLAALTSETPAVRLRVIDALGAFPQAQSVRALTALAERGPEASVRRRALRALGATGSEKAAAPLVAALDRAEDRREQAIIVDALANVASPRAAEPLTELLAGSDDPVLKVKTAAALGAIGGEGLLPALTGLLGDDNRAVRMAAVRELTEARAPETAPQLLALYRDLAERRPPRPEPGAVPDPAAYLADLDLMRLTTRALLETDPRVGLAAFLDGAQPRIFDRGSATGLKLASKAYELRRLAVVALGYTRSASASDPLRAIAASGSDPRLRAAAVRSLGVLGRPGSFAAASKALADSHPEVRWNAAVVLGRLGRAEALPALIGALEDPHAQVRLQSAASLGLLGDPRAAAALEALRRRERNEKVKETARQALLLLGDGGNR